MKQDSLKTLILLCGFGHIILSVASTIIPKVLQWNIELKKLPPLLRQMFWTYAAYILVINAGFGIISIIGMYWLARIIIQFTYFDKTNAPKGIIFRLGEVVLVTVFILFTLVYLTAFLYNNSWI
jgi:hypothetical protein